MPVSLTPEYHQYIGAAIAQNKTDVAIIGELVTKFNLTIPDAKELINTVISMNDHAKSTLTTNGNQVSNNIRVSTINPYIKELKDGANTATIQGKEIRFLVSMENPGVVLMEDFLDEIECQHLIDLASNSLSKSTVAVHGKGSSTVSDYRTSDNATVARSQDDIVKSIENRISGLFNWNINDTDDFQILRYRIGEEYKPHFDFFTDGSSFVKGVGERIATLILYLGEPTKGGGTKFPDLNLNIHCKRGSALFFTYPNPTPDSKTLHAGAPVIEGTKWIATKWFRSLDKQI